MTYREYRRQHALDDLAFAIAHRRAVYRPFLNDVHESGRSNVRAKLKELEKFYAKQRARIEELKAQLLQNQEGLIEILRAQLTEQEARAESVEKLAHEWAEVAAERRTRIGELEAKLLVEQGTISQLRAQRLELEKANVALRKGAE